MKLDQIAYYCKTDDEAQRLKVMLNLEHEHWIRDRVTARCTVWGKPNEINIASLQFCEKLGMQFEIIRPIQGHHWLEREVSTPTPMVAHVGLHLDVGEAFPAMNGCALAQEAHTVAHTCEYLTTGAAAGRKYHYKVFEVSPHNYMKFIRRIEP
jgi:hypothetical protein